MKLTVLEMLHPASRSSEGWIETHSKAQLRVAVTVSAAYGRGLKMLLMKNETALWGERASKKTFRNNSETT